MGERATARSAAPALVSCVLFVVALLGCAGGENRGTESPRVCRGTHSLSIDVAQGAPADAGVHLGVHTAEGCLRSRGAIPSTAY